MGRLILICEGDAHTVEYFHRNGVYPGAVVFTATRFRAMSPYLTADDEVLVVIKGLTDFNMAEIYALLGDIDENRPKLKSAVVMSNMPLGKIDNEYYRYTGDLFYGNVHRVKNGKNYELGEDKPMKKAKATKGVVTPVNSKVINSVMERYTLYDKRSISRDGIQEEGFKIYGKPERKMVANETELSQIRGIVKVDVFKTK